LGTPVAPSAVTTIGITIGILVIVSAFLLTGIYVIRANRRFDALTNALQEDLV
jgi:uncharacterized membrane protein (DUF485 family)